MMHVVIQVPGLGSHAIEWGFHNGYFLEFNRGYLSKMPIEAFRINPKLLTTKMLHNLDFSNPEAYLRTRHNLLRELEGDKDRITEVLEKFNPLREAQIVGNCSYESLETAIFGTLALDELLHSDGTEAQDVLAIASSFEVSQALSNHIRLNALEDALEDAGEHIPRDMIMTIFSKELEELQSLDEKHSTAYRELMQLINCTNTSIIVAT